MSNTQYTTNDYGSNISLSDNEGIFFETNVDNFLPDNNEFDSSWTAGQYIDEYLSYFDLTTEQAEYAKNALWSSKLRYMAEDQFTQWESEQN